MVTEQKFYTCLNMTVNMFSDVWGLNRVTAPASFFKKIWKDMLHENE